MSAPKFIVCLMLCNTNYTCIYPWYGMDGIFFLCNILHLYKLDLRISDRALEGRTFGSEQKSCKAPLICAAGLCRRVFSTLPVMESWLGINSWAQSLYGAAVLHLDMSILSESSMFHGCISFVLQSCGFF